MNETILLELQLKLAEAQRDVAIAEKNLAAYAFSHSHIAIKENQSQSQTILSRILNTLKDCESMPTDSLAVRCGATIYVVRVTLNRAKSKGLVRLQKQPHSRFAVWSLTEKGSLETTFNI